MGSVSSVRLEFGDVVKCRDVAEFHLFVRRYFRERAIFDLKERRSHFWALFYAWKESLNLDELKELWLRQRRKLGLST